jgi:archaellum biogenesis ATPase FlaH
MGNKTKAPKPNYSYEMQSLYLEMFLADAETFIRCQNIFNPEYFDQRLRLSATFITEYVDQYKAMPDVSIVNANTKSKFSPITLPKENYDWLMDEFEQFARHKALEHAILKSADLLEEGDYGPVEKMIKEAVQISLTKDMGINYFEDPRARLLKLKNSNGQMSTGWPSVDAPLYGGFSRGDLIIFAACSGGGKSLFLANLGVNWANMGLNVVYVTLELSEPLVAMRIDSMITGIPNREIFKNLDDVELKVKTIGRKSGSIQIKYLPSGKTANDIRAYLKEYQVKKGCKPDIILVDYLDLLMPISAKISADSLFTKDKYVSEELRNLAMESNAVLVSAAQINRCLKLDTIVEVNGNKIQIKDVNVGDYITSNEGPVRITDVLPIIKQPVFKIKTKSSKEIICSANHKFPTQNGVKTINSGLKVGEKLQVFNEIIDEWDGIDSIEYIGEEETIDINVSGNRLFYANDILTHNSGVDEPEFDHSHISGGISKIQTADNVIGIFTSRAMRERGRYQIQFMKTRNSSGVGQKIDLGFDIDSLRISDLGEDSEPSASPVSSVYAGLKKTSVVTPADISTENMPKIKAEYGSTRLKQMLNNLNPEQD